MRRQPAGRLRHHVRSRRFVPGSGRLRRAARRLQCGRDQRPAGRSGTGLHEALDSAIKAGAKDELLSQRQYNLGRIKRLLGKHVEAEALYKQALATEEAALPRSDARIGRRLVELASALSAQGKWQEGAAYLERSLPVLHKLSDTSRAYSAEVLHQYAKQLQGGAQAALGRRFMETAAILK